MQAQAVSHSVQPHFS